MDSAAALRLGELLVRAGVIDAPTLDEALRRKRSYGARLGEVLVAMGRLDPEDLPALLGLQADLREGADEAQVNERLRRRIAETLPEAEPASGAVLQRFVACQRRLAAVAVAGVALADALAAA
jgi:hypothetical protein